MFIVKTGERTCCYRLSHPLFHFNINRIQLTPIDCILHCVVEGVNCQLITADNNQDHTSEIKISCRLIVKGVLIV